MIILGKREKAFNISNNYSFSFGYVDLIKYSSTGKYFQDFSRVGK